jgi:hypothetical protein
MKKLFLCLALLLPASLKAHTLSTDFVRCGTETAIPVKFAAINVGTGDSTIVGAVTGKKIRVLSYVLTSDTLDGLAQFEDGTGGTALTGDMRFADNGVLSVNCAPSACFETTAGTLLNLQATVASFDGHLTYVEC